MSGAGMRIFAIMFVKDEADIVGETLTAAREWADRVYVLDNMSSDGSWERIQALADDQIVAWKQESRPFSQALRAEVFDAFRTEAREGDWWCYKFDADEFYPPDTRAFLAAVPWRFHSVYKRSIDYVLTEEDVAQFEFAGDFSRDRARIRHFLPVAHAERRFFRYRRSMRWPFDADSPSNCGVPYPRPIVVKHFQFRSPQQMQRRLDLRNAIPRDRRGKPFRHVTQTHWRELLRRSEEVLTDGPAVDYESVPLDDPFVHGTLRRIRTRLALARERVFS